MKNLFRKKIFWLILALIILGGGGVYYYQRSSTTGVVYTTQPVVRTNLKQTVSATGKVKPAEEINLNFETSGRISQINVKTGSEVKAGDILATLQTSELASKVTKAQATLNQYQASLAKAIAGATAEEIEVSKRTVAKAQTDLDNAKINLADAKLTYNQDIANAQEDVISDCEKATTKAEISLNTANGIIVNDDYKYYLSVRNQSYLQSAKADYPLVVEQVNVAKDANTESKILYDEVKVNQAITETLAALDKVASYLSEVSNVLTYTNTGATLSQTTLDSLKTSVNTERTTTDTSRSTILTSKQALADAQLTYQTEVNDAQATINADQDSLAKAQADLALKLAPTRIEDINLYRAQVRQAQADLLIAEQSLAKANLLAPTNGVITEVVNKVGERVGETDTVIKMLATGPFEIEVNIPESDIAKIHVGDKTETTLDAFTDDIIFVGRVTTINPAQTEIQDVIYYQVTISLTSDQPEAVRTSFLQIKPGMTANITIAAAAKENVLVIPQRAVKEKDGKKFVQILDLGQPKEIEVTLGLRGDEGLIEVLSGLEAGQEVITFVKEKK